MPARPEVPNALRNFDLLPDSALVRQPTVEALLGISSSTLWRRVRDGSLKPIKPSQRVTAFRVGDIRSYMASRAA